MLSYATSYIESPWGAGQFRPAVIVPAFFATIFGPLVGGIGAALGTLIADSLKHAQLYAGSYLASAPGNFIGFFLFGYIANKKFSWQKFIIASEVTLLFANALVAFLYVYIFKVFYLADPKYMGMSASTQVFFSLGLTIWWYVTMLPFVLVVTPVLIRAASSAFPLIVSERIQHSSLREELPLKSFSLAMIIPGIFMIVLGLATSLTSLGLFMQTYFGMLTFTLVQLMFYLSGAVLTGLGVLFYFRKILLRKGN